jgi:hypothetical protein
LYVVWEELEEITATMDYWVNWECNNPEFLSVIKTIQIPMHQWYPDYNGSLVRYVAQRYCATVTDTRNFKPDDGDVEFDDDAEKLF